VGVSLPSGSAEPLHEKDLLENMGIEDDPWVTRGPAINHQNRFIMGVSLSTVLS
jgi:hypothetical protein